MNILDIEYKHFFKYIRTNNDVKFDDLESFLKEENIRFYNKEDPLRNWIIFKQIIEYNKLFVPHYSKLNDPFECIINIEHPNDIDDHILTEFYNKKIDKTEFPNFIDFKQKMLSFTEEKKFSPFLPPLPLGIYSLNIDPTNIQMWTHYSNNHEGICIAFSIDWNYIIKKIKMTQPNIELEEIIENLKNKGIQFSYHLNGETFFFALQRVDYLPQVANYSVNNYIKAHYDEATRDELLWILTSKKHINWQYEEEWRLVCFNQYSRENQDLIPLNGPFIFIKPCAIILGYRMAQNIKDLIISRYHGKYPIVSLSPTSDEVNGFSYSLSPNKQEIVKLINKVIKPTSNKLVTS